ncbi:outer membrane protein assembly factor BamE domain-containing protein [Shigella flexneri]
MRPNPRGYDTTAGRLCPGNPDDVRSVRHNTWFDVFRQQPGHEDVTQQTLTLTFSSAGVLTKIDNKPALTK